MRQLLPLYRMLKWLPAMACLLAGCRQHTPIDYSGAVAQWPEWGYSEGGLRHSPLTQITPQNVDRLKVAWTYRTGDIPLKKESGQYAVGSMFEATPIVNDGRMYLCTPTNRVIALDPETGKELWTYDPKLDWGQVTSHFNCRGVTFYRDAQAAPNAACAARILTGTLDGRLIALDAADGRLCADFGRQGTVDLLADLGDVRPGEYNVTSPPAVIGGRVVVGGHILDGGRIDMPAGVVRAYDVRSGAPIWAWNPLPPGVSDGDLAPAGEKYARGTPNAWGVFSVDASRDLLFVPLGNVPGDFFGGDRNGIDYYAGSVVALQGSTGKVVWRFQTVHHDLWDFDASSQPVLFDFPSAHGPIPAVAQAAKHGYVFILDRETGEPLVPVEERPAPQEGAVPGERPSPTQPTPSNAAYILDHQNISEDMVWGFTPWDRAQCRKLLQGKRNTGLFTPPSLEGTINPVGWSVVNWGGFAIDPQRDVLIVNTMHMPSVRRLVPIAASLQADAETLEAKQNDDSGKSAPAAVDGRRYTITGSSLVSPFGAPCARPPWGQLIAIDLKAGRRLWQVPLGATRDVPPFPFWKNMGGSNSGGPIVTASGLAFIAATSDDLIRAFDVATGEKLWESSLPAGGQAIPVTYRLAPERKQYVAIAAGGHFALGTRRGDYVVAYALED